MISRNRHHRHKPMIVGNNSIAEGRSAGEPSAILQIEDANGGFLTSRLTNAQRDAIESPAEGLMIWNSDAKQMEIFVGGTGGNWGAGVSGGGAVSAVFGRSGNVIAVAGDYDASLITNTPSGNLTATNVQAALSELQGDIDTLSGTPVVASAVSSVASGNLTATNVQAALSELQGDIDALTTATLYGPEQVDVIIAATHDWDWSQSQNFLFTTADQASVTVNYPTGVAQGHQVSVVFTSTNPSGTTFDLSAMVDVEGNALPDLTLANGESKRIIFGTTNALFVAALDYPKVTNTTTELDDLSDVDVSTAAPTLGQTLSWDGSNFVPTTITESNLYTTDGTLTGARNVAMGGNDITFSGAGSVVISDAGDITVGNNTSVAGDFDATGNGTITGNLNVTGNTTVIGNLTTDSQLLLLSDTSDGVGFVAPSGVGTTVIWSLPGSDGVAGSTLTTDGSGVLSWTTPADKAQDVVADITARDAITGSSIGDYAYVVDASTDTDVDSGAALYVWDGAAWQKIGEFESLDLVDFVGADGTSAGASGLVPAPAITDNVSFLRGDGTWAGAGNARVFITNTVTAPAVAGAPTLSEVGVAAIGVRDSVIYYNGTDLAATDPTYVYYADVNGVITEIQAPSSADNFVTSDLTTATGTNRTHTLDGSLVIAGEGNKQFRAVQSGSLAQHTVSGTATTGSVASRAQSTGGLSQGFVDITAITSDVEAKVELSVLSPNDAFTRSFSIVEDEVRLVSEAVRAGTATAGQVLTLVNSANGSVEFADTNPWTRVTAAATLISGNYALDSNTAGFAITLTEEIGEWEFADHGFALDSNPIVIGNALQTFTDNTGTQVAGPVTLDENGTIFKLVNTDGSSDFLLLKRPIPSITTNVVANGSWDATTNTPDLTLAANQGDGNNVYTYLVTVAGTQDIGQGPTAYAVGGQVTFFDQTGAGAVFRYDAPTPPTHVEVFDATVDWGTAAGGFYTITVAAATHAIAAPMTVQVWEDVVGDFEMVQPDRLRITAAGDITFRVAEAPDARFAGRVVIR